MNKIFLYGTVMASVICGGNAQALEFAKPITASVIVSQANNSATAAALSQRLSSKKYVTLMNIQLTTKQKQALLHYPPNNNISLNNSIDRSLPRQVDVGMNGVPVLEQGAHGSCVTFANTAAVDALLGKGDYISQLCNLTLGSYFEEKGYLPSGWGGSIGPIVLNQILGFGIINKTNQNTKSCGGLKEYPVLNPHELGSPMSLDEFKLYSEPLNENLYWDAMLSLYQRFQWESSRQAEELLFKVKKSLAVKVPGQDSRLTFAAILPVDYCSAGACARYHAEEDTWALTKAIINDRNPEFGGHEMVITGYNDDAIAIDHDGTKHQGLLTLRNSWGSNAGDHGDYYMTYDFFKQFVFEVQQIVIFND